MWHKNIFFFLILSIAASNALSGQENATGKEDTSKVYRKIEHFADKTKITKFIHKLVFNPIPVSIKPHIGKQAKKLPPKSNSSFEGKIIRRINISVLDPFGYSINDTAESPHGLIEKTGNKIHKTTLPLTIRNLLIINRNTPFDNLLAKESERLIRSQKYVREVILIPVAVRGQSDSVDVNVLVHDVWSINPSLEMNSARVEIGLTENNFIGSGHQFQNKFTWNHVSGHSAYAGKYFIPNINNSYINTTFQYRNEENRDYTRSWTIERPIYSSYAKWGAGAYFAQQLQKDSIIYPDSAHMLQNFKFDVQDIWVGKAWQIFRGKSEEQRSTNLILTGRFLKVRYLQMPNEIFDSLHIYSNEQFMLSGIGISTRKYVRDRYIFNTGFTEDVPVGRVFGIVGGYQTKDNIGRFYTGLKISWGNYYSWGYFSPNLEYGAFLKSTGFEEVTIRAEINYFSGLFEIGKWKFRQFVKPMLILGFDRLPTDKLTITGGILGFNSKALFGTHRTLITLQTQSYAPWNIWGFRFAPYINCTLGMLGNESSGFRYGQLYSQFGLGVLIRNEYLVFNTFQISLAFYPHISGDGDNIFKLNPYRANSFGFRDFDLQKPATILFQ
jgi:hypothetical protein